VRRRCTDSARGATGRAWQLLFPLLLLLLLVLLFLFLFLPLMLPILLLPLLFLPADFQPSKTFYDVASNICRTLATGPHSTRKPRRSFLGAAAAVVEGEAAAAMVAGTVRVEEEAVVGAGAGVGQVEEVVAATVEAEEVAGGAAVGAATAPVTAAATAAPTNTSSKLRRLRSIPSLSFHRPRVIARHDPSPALVVYVAHTRRRRAVQGW
jgi:hypothetical protein